ncbi:MAG: Bug family tripartite tricarboxylate transporter substrate binding protein [Pigmentiphaga sp.]|uniref:Bug family tripartite tricarboxylate transporter substrate binding protein n=1 Tax=Pigmentiphaga sp. TaxID=1977564 RepID=UPI003B567EC4
MIRRFILKFAAAFFVLFAAGGAACADDYPSRPITLVAPFPPGGALDLIARALAQKLQEQWGQTVVVDNRSGAAGIIGSTQVARSTPDGYTILLGATTTHGINPSLYKSLQYDAVADFEPVSLVATIPHLLVVNPGLPVHTFGDFVKLAKEKTLPFGSAGIGSPHHLAGEMLKSQLHLNLQHIPYKGSAPAMTAVMSGETAFMSVEVTAASQYIKAGKMRPIAVAAAKRLPTIDVPTFAEVGLPGFEVTAWYAIFAPKGTPRPIVDKLSQALAKAVHAKDVQTRFASLDATPVGSTPDELRRYVDSEIKRWALAVKAANVSMD